MLVGHIAERSGSSSLSFQSTMTAVSRQNCRNRAWIYSEAGLAGVCLETWRRWLCSRSWQGTITYYGIESLQQSRRLVAKYHLEMWPLRILICMNCGRPRHTNGTAALRGHRPRRDVYGELELSRFESWRTRGIPGRQDTTT